MITFLVFFKELICHSGSLIGYCHCNEFSLALWHLFEGVTHGDWESRRPCLL